MALADAARDFAEGVLAGEPDESVTALTDDDPDPA
jgi:hypothetical protein